MSIKTRAQLTWKTDSLHNRKVHKAKMLESSLHAMQSSCVYLLKPQMLGQQPGFGWCQQQSR